MESKLVAMIATCIVLMLACIASAQTSCNLPCGEHGLCYRASEASSPMCTCKLCWTGTYCDTPITGSGCPSAPATSRRIVVVGSRTGASGTKRDVCKPNPCRGSGYCQADPTRSSGFRCTCVNKRSGARCQRLMKKPRNPCRESSTLCSGGICHSPPDMIGHMCKALPTAAPPAIAITEPCARNPCQAQGYCQPAPDRPEGYLCTCINSRSGTHCETALSSPRNPCRESDTLCSGETCHSPPTMIGHMCIRPAAGVDSGSNPVETVPRLAAPIIDPCSPNPCRANGRCEVDRYRSNGFRCECPSNRRGIRCQTRVSMP